MLTGKPASSWLDRLRSSKGIPLTTDLNLDEFLNQNLHNSHDSISIPSRSNPNSPHESRGEDEWFTSMSSVLAELFVMEEDENNKPQHHKKHSRKQPNPKVCIFAATSPSSADNSVAEVKDEENKSEKLNLLGFSRSDVVIIDTSSSGVWKTEKRVIRKGNVWKVRETKSKALKLRSLLVCRKKRKFKEFDGESEDEIKKRMRKVKKKKQKISLNLIQDFHHSRDQVATKETKYNPDQVCIKRCKFFRSLAKPIKRSSVKEKKNITLIQ